jgi:hypothetical protein
VFLPTVEGLHGDSCLPAQCETEALFSGTDRGHSEASGGGRARMSRSRQFLEWRCDLKDRNDLWYEVQKYVIGPGDYVCGYEWADT